ncbi:MAG: M14 family metallopeptidase [Fimbriimonadaceae bacterium]
MCDLHEVGIPTGSLGHVNQYDPASASPRVSGLNCLIVPAIDFSRYYRYDQLSDLLKQFASEFPKLVCLEHIGTSHEGRPILMATVTNQETGADLDKPAFWCDANIHATELSASTAVLNIIHKLCTEYGNDPSVTRAVDTRTFYLVPRLNPDGAELAMADRPRFLRSSTRPYPFDEEELEGLELMDVDGDGRILNMRIKDPNGRWAISEEEPRLLRKRRPEETGGEYYRLFYEGLFHNFDGLTYKPRRNKERLDLNRNFPSAWRLEHEQYGAGPYPTSEPEVAAAVKAISDRPNICGAITFHTFSGVHLRPPSRFADDEMPSEDIWLYKEIGQKGTELTGYPAISNFHEFKYHPKEVITGVFDDWVYEHRGAFAWTTEIWSPQRQAGITDYKYIEWWRDHPFEDDLKMLKWSDEKLGGRGYIDWYPFEHPQLGQVELGGWDSIYAFRNPPFEYLEAEVKPMADWVIWQALISPKLEILRTEVTQLEPGLAKIRFAVQNTGFLPTYVTKIANDRKLVRGVVAEIGPDGPPSSEPGTDAPDWLISGNLRETAGQLEGWANTPRGSLGMAFDDTSDIAVFEWVVASGQPYHVSAKHERGGKVETVIET